MPLVHLPRKGTLAQVVARLAEEGLFSEAWDVLSLHLPRNTFLHSSAIAFLCSWGQLQIAAGRELRLSGDADAVRYLARMDFHRHLGLAYEETFTRHSEAGRFLALRQVTDGDDANETVNRILDLLLYHFENAQQFVPAVEWVINELIDNIVTHAEAPVPGAVHAQFFPEKQRIDLAICDVGRGIKASLAARYRVRGHGEAIKKALERGVTDGRGQGAGLSGTREVAARNHGELAIWSGDSLFRLTRGKERFQTLPAVPGTGVVLSLDTRRVVNLEDTSVHANMVDWNYLYSEAERMEERGGLEIAEECLHTGGRRQARGLANKLQSLLPKVKGRLVLDFTGIASASTSFLDELIGRLYEELGEVGFEQRLRLVGMNDALRGLTNAVLSSRQRRGS